MWTDGWVEGIPVSPSGRGWVFPNERVVYTETVAAVPSVGDANSLIDFFLWLTNELEGWRPFIVHDWRSVTELPRATRRAFIERRGQIPVQPEKLIIAVTMNPMLRMALQTVSLGAQLAIRTVPMSLVDSPVPTMRRLGVGTPDAALHARLRRSWRHARDGVEG